MTKSRIRILLVDDQRVFVDSLKMYLEEISDELDVIGIACNGARAVELVDIHKPDIILMDVRMPVLDGVEAIRSIHSKYPNAKVLMLTTFDDDSYVYNALQHGAVGYLLKEDIDGDELLNAIRAAASGSVLFSPQIASKLMGSTDGSADEGGDVQTDQRNELPNWYFTLSKKERKILTLILEGLENCEISEEIHLVEQTVKNYISIIYSKLGTHNRAQTIRVARDFRRYL